MKISLWLEDCLAAVALMVCVGLSLYPVMSLEPERSVVASIRPLPERCVFPEKVEGCGDQQWIAQGCAPFTGPEITCVNATSRKASK